MEPGSLVEYGDDHGFNMVPASLDGHDCVKLLRDEDWVATAQAVAALNCAPAAPQVWCGVVCGAPYRHGGLMPIHQSLNAFQQQPGWRSGGILVCGDGLVVGGEDGAE